MDTEDILEQSWVIYLITNKLNGMQYVGQTKCKLKYRIEHHKRYSDYYIGRAIQAYGWENFTVEVIEKCNTSEKLNEREIFWIKELDTKSPKGYNLTDGGDGANGRIVTESERILRAEMNPYKHAVRCLTTGEVFTSVSEAARHFNANHSIISAVCRGKQISTVGHRFEYVDNPLSEEAKLRQPKKFTKKVRCIDNGMVFNSITEASTFFGIRAASITRVCNGTRLSANGMRFEYIDDKYRQQAEVNKSHRPPPLKKPVRCVELGIVFESAVAAAEFAKVHASNITAACHGRQDKSGGYHWQLV